MSNLRSCTDDEIVDQIFAAIDADRRSGRADARQADDLFREVEEIGRIDLWRRALEEIQPRSAQAHRCSERRVARGIRMISRRGDDIVTRWHY